MTPEAFVIKQYNVNLLSFHSNNCGNIVFTTQNDGITIEWQQFTAVKSFITIALAYNGTKLITTVKKIYRPGPSTRSRRKAFTAAQKKKR